MTAFDKKGREELDRLATQMKAHLDRVDASGKPWTSEDRETYHKMEADYTAKEELVLAREKNTSVIDKLAQPHEPGSGPRIVPGEVVEQAQDEYRLTPRAYQERQKLYKASPHARAFGNYLRQPINIQAGSGGLGADDQGVLAKFQVQNAQSTTTTQGGYLIPQGFSDQLEEAMLWYGGIDGVVQEFDTATGAPMPWPTVNDTMNKGAIIGQNVQVSEQDFVFGQVTFQAYIGSSLMVLIPVALIEDSYFDMEGLTAQMLGTRLGRLLNWKGTVGTGSAEPTGIVNAGVTAGNILTLGAGNTASIAYANLVDLEALVDPAYRYNPGSRWMFADAELKLLKKLVDGQNRPLWQPGISASFREGAAVDLVASKPMILDHPYVINQDMAVPAASAYSMLFGDMKRFKVRRVAGGITVLRLVERYADYWQIGFVAFMRFDTNLIDAGTHPVAVLQQSAS